MEKCYHLEKQKSWPMTLAMENCAKKVQVTPRTKNCIPSSSNLTGIINVLKLTIESILDQESEKNLLEVDTLKRELVL